MLRHTTANHDTVWRIEGYDILQPDPQIAAYPAHEVLGVSVASARGGKAIFRRPPLTLV